MKYGIVTTIAATAFALTPEEVANYLRVDASDPAISGEMSMLISLSTDEVQRMTGRALVATTFKLVADDWPTRDTAYSGIFSGQEYVRTVELPRSPLISVTSVQYYDEAGVLQTLDPAQYVVSNSFEPGLVYLQHEYTWPSLARRPDAVQVTFTAGYASAAATPAALKQAMLLLCRHFNSSGNPNQTADRTSDLETAKQLLQGLRVGGWSA